tara:strand:- start:89 stop:202 length:114 start_codon:yes stop_codon:yes gene_type:complete
MFATFAKSKKEGKDSRLKEIIKVSPITSYNLSVFILK